MTGGWRENLRYCSGRVRGAPRTFVSDEAPFINNTSPVPRVDVACAANGLQWLTIQYRWGSYIFIWESTLPSPPPKERSPSKDVIRDQVPHSS